MTEAMRRNPTFSPEDCALLFGQAMPNGDIETILELYEPGAVWYSLVSGNPLLREEKEFKKEYMWLTARNATVRFDQIKTVFNKDNQVAFVEIRAVFEGRDPDGKEVIIPYTSHQITRKQPDNTWRIIYEKPQRERLRQ
ncbi:MAG: hypothetical protein RR212_06945 [Bacteroidales bacterium]